MYIDTMSFVLFFPKIEKIRQKSTELEESLKKYFLSPFTLLPIPEDVPPEIPRIIAESPNGHSRFTMSLINLQLDINFDDMYNEEIGLCFDYLEDRVELINDVIKECCNNIFLFAGVSARVILNNDIPNTMEFLSEKFVGIKSRIEPYNINNKVAYVLEDAYYLNFNIANMRVYEDNHPATRIKPKLTQVSNQVSVEIDINDKYGYNHNQEYQCTEDSINYIIKLSKEFIQNELCNVLLKGEELYGNK